MVNRNSSFSRLPFGAMFYGAFNHPTFCLAVQIGTGSARTVASMQGLTAPDFFRMADNTPRISFDQMAYLGTE
jgi:hypothetical protein